MLPFRSFLPVIFVSLAMDVMIIGLMSLPSSFVYMQFHRTFPCSPSELNIPGRPTDPNSCRLPAAVACTSPHEYASLNARSVVSCTELTRLSCPIPQISSSSRSRWSVAPLVIFSSFLALLTLSYSSLTLQAMSSIMIKVASASTGIENYQNDTEADSRWTSEQPHQRCTGPVVVHVVNHVTETVEVDENYPDHLRNGAGNRKMDRISSSTFREIEDQKDHEVSRSPASHTRPD